jgi:hypothetical protein
MAAPGGCVDVAALVAWPGGVWGVYRLKGWRGVSDERPPVLLGDTGGRAERLGGVQRLIWIAQKLARQQYHIRLSGANDSVGLMRFGDHPHRR